MMPDASPPQPPLRFELMQADNYARYQLHRRAEILFVLRALVKARSLISVYCDDSEEFFLTTLIDAGDDKLVFDVPADPRALQRAVAARRLVMVTSHDRVKIQFAPTGARSVVLEGRPALETDVPERLLRLQRREYYRLIAQTSPALHCEIELDAGGGTRTVAVEVADLSGGGIAILAPPAGMSFAVDERFENCRLELPGTGVVNAHLRICNVFEVTLPGGRRVQRCGCQFMGLPGTSLALIERYIMRIERERKARQAGVA